MVESCKYIKYSKLENPALIEIWQCSGNVKLLEWKHTYYNMCKRSLQKSYVNWNLRMVSRPWLCKPRYSYYIRIGRNACSDGRKILVLLFQLPIYHCWEISWLKGIMSCNNDYIAFLKIYNRVKYLVTERPIFTSA